jgi:GNAT superfamily N-acetyltransferase
MSSTPTADTSVRLAWPDDAEAIAEVQVAAWRHDYADLLPAQVLDELDPAAFAEVWRTSVVKPGDARDRVLVALERNVLRGFAVTIPSTDPDSDAVDDAEIAELVVHPEHRGAGHGSRLVHACADTMRADRFTRATTWLTATDDDRRRFLTVSGWAPDGAHRELDLSGDGSVRVKQVRLHTALD